MRRENLSDLLAFLAVARDRSFTKAAATLGVSRSALSHTLRGLEARLGFRLLTRTTRSVSPTQAGERLLQTAGHHIEEIEAELEALSELRDKPAGSIRITATEYASNSVLLPKLAKLLPQYPDIKVEIIVDYGLTDIAAQRYDAGVRWGEHHNCINLRLPSHGGLYPWEFEKGRRKLNVRVDGQLVLNSAPQMVNAALAGFGLACVPEGMVELQVAAGHLRRVLEDWCPASAGYHLYYPSRRQTSPAFALLVDALRYSLDRAVRT